MSAPLRYARILNGLSSLISSRSAISRRTRAMAPLSNPQPLRLDAIVEQPRAARRQRVADRRARGGWAVAEETAAAARAADLRGGGAGRPRSLDQRIDRRRRHARCEAFAVLPLDGDLASDFVPVAALERGAHGDGGIANPFEAVEDVPVAVDVPLGDLPVVRPRVAGRAGVGEHDAALQFVRVDVERDAADAVSAQFDGGDPAVERGAVVLDAGRDADRLAFDVHRDLQDVGGLGRR